jgi:hypothetical protein
MLVFVSCCLVWRCCFVSSSFCYVACRLVLVCLVFVSSRRVFRLLTLTFILTVSLSLSYAIVLYELFARRDPYSDERDIAYLPVPLLTLTLTLTLTPNLNPNP